MSNVRVIPPGPEEWRRTKVADLEAMAATLDKLLELAADVDALWEILHDETGLSMSRPYNAYVRSKRNDMNDLAADLRAALRNGERVSA